MVNKYLEDHFSNDSGHPHFLSLRPVMPHPPEKVLVSVLEDKDWPFLRVSWEPPQKADTRSGWITLIYEIRIKLQEEDDWEVCRSLLVQGKQTDTERHSVN